MKKIIINNRITDKFLTEVKDYFEKVKDFKGFELYESDYYFYLDTKKNKIRKSSVGENNKQTFLKYNNILIEFRSYSSKEMLKQHIQDLKENKDYFKDILENITTNVKPKPTDKELKKAIEKDKEQERIERKKRKEAKREKEKKEKIEFEKEIKENIKDFKEGKSISGEDFFNIVRYLNIDINIRTLGAIRNFSYLIINENESIRAGLKYGKRLSPKMGNSIREVYKEVKSL